MTTEQWRPIPGWEGLYEVSDHGNVRSLDREVTSLWGTQTTTKNYPGTTLKPHIDKLGYCSVTLQQYSTNRKKHPFIHTLVLEAFTGPRPDGKECCHNDGNKQNCKLSNLRWDTHLANMQDVAREAAHKRPPYTRAPDAQENHYSARTHCKNGHEFTPENTLSRPDGGRRCLICKREYARKSREVIK